MGNNNFKEMLKKINEVLSELKKARKDEDKNRGRRIQNEKWRSLSEASIKLVIDSLNEIISGDSIKLVEGAEILGKCFAENGLTNSQIRNIFNEIKQMEMEGYDKERTRKRLILLKPKLNYTAARESKVKDLKDIMLVAIDKVIENIDEEKFDNFCKFFEAILAYHRAAGGK